MPVKVSNLFVLLAREVSTDAMDNMSTITKVIDKFNFNVDLEQFERDKVMAGDKHVAVPINYDIATSWLFSEKLPKDTFLTFKISILDPDDEDLGGPEQENLVPATMNRINMNFKMQQLPLTESGTYHLHAEVHAKDGKLLAQTDYPFEVEITNGPAQN
jgi:hypothetical protein